MSTPGPGNPFEGMPFFGDLARMFLGAGPVNWDLARQTAQWLALDGGTSEANVEPVTRIRYEELYRVAEMHVADATGLALSTGGGGVTVRTVGRTEWATKTLDAYKALLETLAIALSGAQADASVDDDAPDPAGELLGNLAQVVSPVLLGIQAGMMVGHLSQRALGQYDLPIPRPAGDELLVAARNVDAFASEWSLPADDVRLWVALGELTHHAVLSRPHVRARLEELLLTYVGGFRPDPASLEEKLQDVDPSDADALREALGDPQALLGAMQTDDQRSTLVQLEALACVVVGYVDHVVDVTAHKLIGASGALDEALRRRRVERGEGDRFVERLFGLELGQAQYDRGIAFVRGVLERAGEDGLARLWQGPRELPTSAEVDAAGLWLARIDLGD